MRRLLRIGMVAVVLALGAGCFVNAQKRREAYVTEKHWYSFAWKQAILNGQVMIGMTADDVRVALGLQWDPRINTTITANGRDEQWCLGGTNHRYFLYFTNGVLTCIQN
jgi:hypothetical protein